jgi:hypothetical protein
MSLDDAEKGRASWRRGVQQKSPLSWAPGHSKMDRSLIVSLEDGGFLVHSFCGDSFEVCRDHVRELLGLPFFGGPAETQSPITDEDVQDNEPNNSGRALELWTESTTIRLSWRKIFP